MPDKKLTDNEIIKALECCCGTAHDSCRDCPYSDIGCEDKLEKDALDLINRQKAEIERLNHIVDVNKKVKAEAVKEFAEMVKETAVTNITVGGSTYYCVGLHHLDNLVKEFTEGE